MSDLHHERPRNRRERLEQKDEESNAMLGVLMAGIAALLIAGIVGAFMYATGPDRQSAQAPSPSAPASAPGTTGSGGPAMTDGGINRMPPRQDPRENEQMERDASGNPAGGAAPSAR